MTTHRRTTWPHVTPAELEAAEQRRRLGWVVLDSIRTATLPRVPTLGTSRPTTHAQ